MGDWIVVQEALVPEKIGSIYLAADTRDTKQVITFVGQVRDLGPLAFRDKYSAEMLPDAERVTVGSFVLIPKYNHTRYKVRHDNQDIYFRFIKATDLMAVLDPEDVPTINLN